MAKFKTVLTFGKKYVTKENSSGSKVAKSKKLFSFSSHFHKITGKIVCVLSKGCQIEV